MIVRDLITRKAGKVLVINSDPEITRILEVNLEHANLEIDSAKSGAEALNKIQNDKSDIIILDPALPDMEGAEIHQQIKELPQTNHIPIILISAKLPRKDRISRADDVPTYHITKPFNPKEVVALVQGYLMHKERMVSINQLTGLPNRIQVGKEIDRLIQQQTTFATIYIVMHDLRGINKAYGYAEGDRVVQCLADVVFEAACLFGNPQDLAGYFGGGKFVIISTPWKAGVLCRRIIADYNNRVKGFCPIDHLRKDSAGKESPSGGKEESPIMSIHIAMVTNQQHKFQHHLEVIEAAAEQIDYLRCLPRSNCYLDIKADETEPSPTPAQVEPKRAYKEGMKVMQGMLAWFNFLTREMDIPMNEMKDCLGSLESLTEANFDRKHLDSLKALRQNYNHLTRVFRGIAGLAKSDILRSSGLYDEVDIVNTIDWVVEHTRGLREQKGIKIDTQVTGDISRIIRDKRSLTQSLFHIIRSEIQSSPPDSRLLIRVTDEAEEHICIEICNPNRYIPTKALNNTLKESFSASQPEIMVNGLYPVRMMVWGMGGEVGVTSEKGRGTTYRVTIPKNWQSWIPEVNTLQIAMEISREEARGALKNIQSIASSLVEKVPLTFKEKLELLGSKVQEMGVLCNRSLFLIDDLSNQLETQQDRLLQQEMEQVATLEVILTICREIAKYLHMDGHFNVESTKRVAKYALSIASKFRMSESDRQALRYAALFKDLALSLSPKDMKEHYQKYTAEEAKAVKARYDLLWKSLSTLRYLSPALDNIQYRYERYDGTGGRFGVKGTDIPLGSRILALADTYDYMTSGRAREGKLSPQLAMEKIVEDSGSRFDPNVVNTFLLLWKRKELELAVSES
jgi:response regulator RpfG family c-di-GMP phosphodiesterase